MDEEDRQKIHDFIQAQLPKVPKEKVTGLIEHLVGPEMELTSFEDLKYVTAEMLKGVGAVQRIKLIEAFKNIGKDECSQMKSQPPSSFSGISSQPSTSTQAGIPVSVPLLDSSIFKYSVPWNTLPKSIIAKFEDAKALGQTSIHPTTRDDLKLEICKDLKQKYDEHCKKHRGLQKSPGQKIYEGIVEEVFKRYGPCLQDVVGKHVVGNGRGGFLHSLSVCIGNLCRRQASEPPRKKGDVKLLTKGQVGVVKKEYLPDMTEEQELEQQIIKNELKAMSTNKNMRDWEDIVPNLEKSYSLQRKDIVAATEMVQLNNDEPEEIQAIRKLASEWPYLFQWRGMECHYQRLVGQPLLANLADFCREEMELFMSYLACGIPTCTIENFKITQKFLKAKPAEASHAMFSLIQMLGNVFKENVSLLIMSCEKTATPKDVKEKLEVPPHPCLITLGPQNEAEQMYLSIDKEIVSIVSSSSEALCLLFASYFVFGCSYPEELIFTFEVLERLVFNLQLSGSKLTKKNSMAVISSRVQKLLNGFNHFKSEVNIP